MLIVSSYCIFKNQLTSVTAVVESVQQWTINVCVVSILAPVFSFEARKRKQERISFAVICSKPRLLWFSPTSLDRSTNCEKCSRTRSRAGSCPSCTASAASHCRYGTRRSGTATSRGSRTLTSRASFWRSSAPTWAPPTSLVRPTRERPSASSFLTSSWSSKTWRNISPSKFRFGANFHL